jgi:hypothetical protein
MPRWHHSFKATSPGNFIFWILALGSIGALGYVKDLRQFSHYFMALILISMILSNRGFFAKLSEAIKAGPTAPTAQSQPSGSSTPITQNSSSSDIAGAITSNQQGVGGSAPATAGQGKFNGWMNYLFGTGTVTQ